jgi:hypothetical protein
MADQATVDGLSEGDHACLTFSDPEERLDLLAAFVREGLRQGQKVVCWTDDVAPDRLIVELTNRAVRPGAALRRGQLTVSAAGSLTVAPAGSALTAPERAGSAMVDLLAGELDRAGREGYPAGDRRHVLGHPPAVRGR